MKNNLQLAKGVRDFTPEEKILRNQVIDKLRYFFELYGYNPIETPVIERYDLFASKFGAGEQSDAMRETFKFKDQGLRDLVLRTEFTVPFARFISLNPQLRKPFKRYQMGPVFRDGPIKLGRYREFWQCDCDVVGVNDVIVDAELIDLAQDIFAGLDLEVEIRINNRKLLNKFLEIAYISEDKQSETIIIIDKLDKIGKDGVTKELLEAGLQKSQIDSVLEMISIQGTNEEIVGELKKKIGDVEGLVEIEKTLNALYKDNNVVFLPSLARGLAYYTGNVFEVFLKDTSKLSSAVSGGGRYDDMIGGFLSSNEKIPAIGISFGLDTICEALKLSKKVETKKSAVELYIIAIGENNKNQGYKIMQELREKKINCDFDFIGKKVGKAMDYANSSDIPWVLLIGDDEIASEKYTLKNMETGDQHQSTIDDIYKLIKE